MASGKWLLVRSSLLLVIFLTISIISYHFYCSTANFSGIVADNQKLSNGDIVFRKGMSFWSPFFSTLNSHSGYSHVGVIIKEHGELYVIHSDADDLAIKGGVQRTKLSQFIKESSLVKFMHNSMPPDIKANFLKNMQESLIKKIPFDDNFDIHDNGDRLYCTELLWKASVGKLGDVEVIAGKELITVDSVYSSSLLSDF